MSLQCFSSAKHGARAWRITAPPTGVSGLSESGQSQRIYAPRICSEKRLPEGGCPREARVPQAVDPFSLWTGRRARPQSIAS
eukprot:4214051-Pyramimonas_sp.AAC.1